MRFIAFFCSSKSPLTEQRLKSLSVSEQVQAKVKTFYKALWERQLSPNSQSLLAKLPSGLQTDVLAGVAQVGSLFPRLCPLSVVFFSVP